MKNKTTTLTIIFFLLIITTLKSFGDEKTFIYQCDLANSGYCTKDGPQEKLSKMIKYQFDGKIYSSPIIYKDILIIGDNHGIIRAFDMNSLEEIWRFPNIDLSSKRYQKLSGFGRKVMKSYPITTNPAIQEDWLFAGRKDGVLYAAFIGRDHRKSPVMKRFIDFDDELFSTPIVYKRFLYIGLRSEGLTYYIHLKNIFDLGRDFRQEYFSSDKYEREDIVFDYTVELSRLPINPIAIFNTETEFKTHLAVNQKDEILYACSTGKLISFDLATKELLWTYSFKGRTASSPVFFDENIYFATTRTLYSIDRYGRVNWKSYISPTETKTPYPCPAVHKKYNLIFWGSKAFRISDGAKVWDFWNTGEVTVEPLLTKNILYLGGEIKYYSKKKYIFRRGFITGIYLRPIVGNDGEIKRLESNEAFWINLPSPIKSNLTIANKKLYFITEDNTLYSYGN